MLNSAKNNFRTSYVGPKEYVLSITVSFQVQFIWQKCLIKETYLYDDASWTCKRILKYCWVLLPNKEELLVAFLI